MSTKYVTALEDFIRKLQQLPYADFQQISDAMADLCFVLRLGKVEVVMHENEASERLGLFTSNCYYNSGTSEDLYSHTSCKCVSILPVESI